MKCERCSERATVVFEYEGRHVVCYRHWNEAVHKVRITTGRHIRHNEDDR